MHDAIKAAGAGPSSPTEPHRFRCGSVTASAAGSCAMLYPGRHAACRPSSLLSAQGAYTDTDTYYRTVRKMYDTVHNLWKINIMHDRAEVTGGRKTWVMSVDRRPFTICKMPTAPPPSAEVAIDQTARAETQRRESSASPAALSQVMKRKCRQGRRCRRRSRTQIAAGLESLSSQPPHVLAGSLRPARKPAFEAVPNTLRGVIVVRRRLPWLTASWDSR